MIELSQEFSGCESAIDTVLCQNIVDGFHRQEELQQIIAQQQHDQFETSFSMIEGGFHTVLGFLAVYLFFLVGAFIYNSLFRTWM